MPNCLRGVCKALYETRVSYIYKSLVQVSKCESVIAELT